MPTTAIASSAYANAGSLLQPLVRPEDGDGKGKPGLDFASMLKGVVSSAAEAGRAAETQAVAAAAGKGDLVNVVTAVAESEAALETLVSVRDRVISAYEEIMRMPI